MEGWYSLLTLLLDGILVFLDVYSLFVRVVAIFRLVYFMVTDGTYWRIEEGIAFGTRAYAYSDKGVYHI
jgi:hypothetical protein